MPAQTTAAGPKRRASRGAVTPKTAKHSGGHGGEQPGDAAAHAEPGAHLFEEGAEAGDGGAEVEGGQHDADDDQPRRPRARGGARRRVPAVRRSRRGVRAVADAVVRVPLVYSHDTHHRIMG